MHQQWKQQETQKGESEKEEIVRAVEMGGRLFIGRDSNVGAGDRPHATVNAHKSLCALGAVARPNVILFYFLNFFIRVGAVDRPHATWNAHKSLCAVGAGDHPNVILFFFQIFYSRWGGRPPPRDIAVGAGDRPNVILFF